MSDKKTENAVVSFFKKASDTVVDYAKKAWNWFLGIQWNSSVKPVVGWSVFGGIVALSVILMLIFL